MTSQLSVKEIGERLAIAGRSSHKVLCIAGTDNVPPDAKSLASVSRCVAQSMVMAAEGQAPLPIYIDSDSLEGVCPGGQFWLGFTDVPEYVRYFVSTGSENVRGGAAEYLKSDPSMVDATLEHILPITPPGKYLLIHDATQIDQEFWPDVLSYLCFGSAESIRNICTLVHFSNPDPFSPAVIPFGPSCSTFITYPAGLSEKAPKNSVFVGPVDPTGNHYFPPNLLAIGLPAPMAGKMASDLDASFIMKRPAVAYPERKDIV
ncbi:MAG TPA: DUF169 domain-containing protein [Methanoregulaceae archaeon]|nr:DUF169 domain-containing protein [Methanoregulaceae archaeon]